MNLYLNFAKFGNSYPDKDQAVAQNDEPDVEEEKIEMPKRSIQRNKYEKYLPTKTERQGFKSILDLEELQQVSSELVPNKFTGVKCMHF